MNLENAERTAIFMAEKGGNQLIVQVAPDDYKVVAADKMEAEKIESSQIVKIVEAPAEAAPTNVAAAAAAPKKPAAAPKAATPPPAKPAIEPEILLATVDVKLADTLADNGWTVEDAVYGFLTAFRQLESRAPGEGAKRASGMIQIGRNPQPAAPAPAPASAAAPAA